MEKYNLFLAFGHRLTLRVHRDVLDQYTKYYTETINDFQLITFMNMVVLWTMQSVGDQLWYSLLIISMIYNFKISIKFLLLLNLSISICFNFSCIVSLNILSYINTFVIHVSAVFHLIVTSCIIESIRKYNSFGVSELLHDLHDFYLYDHCQRFIQNITIYCHLDVIIFVTKKYKCVFFQLKETVLQHSWSVALHGYSLS